MTQLNRHPILWAIYHACQAVEQCEASPAETAAVIKVGEITPLAERLLDELDACLALLREVVEKALPDSEFYRWLWDECTNEEQDYVKDIRGRIMALLAAHGEPR